MLKSDGLQLCLPVAMLHAFAFGLGYVVCKVLKFNEKTARTVSIETGMQSAALGFLLAQQNFSDPLVAVPSAVRRQTACVWTEPLASGAGVHICTNATLSLRLQGCAC